MHASEGGVEGPAALSFPRWPRVIGPTWSGSRITFPAVPCLLSSLPLYPVTSRRPDQKNNPLAPPEHRKEIQQLFPWPILFVQQLHSVHCLGACNYFCSRFHPIAEQLAACSAWRNSHPRIISDTFHFSRNAERVHVQFRVARIEPHRRIRRKPNRRFHALAALLESFKVQVLVPRERLKSHRLAPALSLQGILRRTQKSGTDIPVCPRVS